MITNERVIRVVDGDTFMTAGRERAVRLANVDAPEKGRPGAVIATRFLSTMILGKNVDIDPVARGYLWPDCCQGDDQWPPG